MVKKSETVTKTGLSGETPLYSFGIVFTLLQQVILPHYQNLWDMEKYPSILTYLEAGGNVLLITRKGQTYIDSDLKEYLGITWAENPLSTIQNCVAAFPGLTDMSFTGNQSYYAVFDTDLSSNESTLLFHETVSFGTTRGLCVWRKPQQGGTYRSNGGQFIFISGRPYRYNADQLGNNIEFVLDNFFLEPSANHRSEQICYLEQNYPNPFPASTMISFYLIQPSNVTLHIFDILGRKIRTLVQQQSLDIGRNYEPWDGKDDKGNDVSSGVYFYQITCNSYRDTRKMLLLK